jgi:hypothetical protein
MIPKEITITGAVFEVSRPEHLQTAEDFAKGDGDFGFSDASSQMIGVSDKIQNEDLAVQVLWHEFVHMVLARAGLDYLLGDKKEEAVVLAMEYAWDDVVALVKATKAASKQRNRKRGPPSGVTPSTEATVSRAKAKRKKKR